MKKRFIFWQTIGWNALIAALALILSWIFSGPWMDIEFQTALFIFSFLFIAYLIIIIWTKISKRLDAEKQGIAERGIFKYIRHPALAANIFFLNSSLAFLFCSWLWLIAIIPIYFIWRNAARNLELFLVKEHGDKYRQRRIKAPMLFPKISQIRFLFFSLIGSLVFISVFIILNFSSLYFRYVEWGSARYASVNLTEQTSEIFTGSFLGELPNHEKVILYNEPDSIVINKLDVSAPLILSPGSSQKELNADLNKGVIIYPGSAMPGQIGNLFLTGHSSVYPWNKTPYGQVFAALDKLEAGDRIVIYYSQRKYVYEVVKKLVLAPKNARLFGTNEKIITLMTCWPIGTNFKRLVVEGKLIQ